jgi:cell division protein FtsL
MNTATITTPEKNEPLLRLRHIPLIVLCIGVLIAGPLSIVWKQVYINELSMRKKTLTEGIELLNREASRLQMVVERLSSTSRIESIARERLELDYPAAAQMVIVKESTDMNTQASSSKTHMNALSRLFGREQK